MSSDKLTQRVEVFRHAASHIRSKFDEIVLDYRKMLNNLLEQNANLRQTHALLLPKLISGQLDVSELDIDIGETAA